MSDSNLNISSSSGSTFFQIFKRLITAAVILAITAFFTPGFSINNIWSLALCAIALSLIDYSINKNTKIESSPFGKGFVGFALAAITLYLTQFFVSGYPISWLAAIIGGLIYGVVDYFIPEK